MDKEMAEMFQLFKGLDANLAVALAVAVAVAKSSAKCKNINQNGVANKSDVELDD